MMCWWGSGSLRKNNPSDVTYVSIGGRLSAHAETSSSLRPMMGTSTGADGQVLLGTILQPTLRDGNISL